MEDKFTTKREHCISLVKNKNPNWKEIFKIAKSFNNVFNKTDLDKISISYECLSGKESFYKMMKYDIDKINTESKTILTEWADKYSL